ncbi:MAG: TatD family hydrolase [bacterium]
MTPIIDVHCHLTSDAFEPDREAVLERARAAGVTQMICVGETAEDNLRVLRLARSTPDVLAALGHYPAHTDEELADQTEALLRQCRDEVVAIGEVGIDHWLAREEADREPQHRLFARFVRLADELDLPLSVHSRSAGRHVIALLRELGARRVCLHAFDGKARYAREAAELGYYFSVPPSIARSSQKQRLVAAVDLDRLLLESDAPVLGPDREERNEPANVLVSARAVAEIKGLPLEEVLQACAANTRALFGPAVIGPAAAGPAAFGPAALGPAVDSP